MRSISSALSLAQKQRDFDSLWKLVLTKGSDTYTYERDVISYLAHLESDYSQTADVVINDPDNDLVDLALQGFKGVISYGLVLPNGAKDYSATAPLWVIPQQLHSLSSGAYCRLSLGGIFNQMNADQASASYEPDADDTNTIKDLINAIAGATLSCYSHCVAWEVVWDSEDGIIDTYQPKDMFNIGKRGSRSSALKKLLSWTNCVAIVKNDGKIHIFVPTTTGTDYDYEYELAEVDVGKHTFFAKTYRKRVVIPNYIVVESHKSHSSQYSGHAQTTDYDELSDEMKKRDFITLRLSSDAQAKAIAEAIRDKYSLDSERGSGKVPMNVGAEQYDYVKITDGRTGDSIEGNVGYIKRVCQPAPDIETGFAMSFGFGKMMEYNPLGLAPASSPLGVGEPSYGTLIDTLNTVIDNLNSLWESHIQLQQWAVDISNWINDGVVAKWQVTRQLMIPVIIQGAPVVTSQAVTDIASTTATGNGEVVSLGSAPVTQYGVCWNATGTPTIAGDKTEEGHKYAKGAFTSSITGLTTGTKYYVRPYATNAEGTSYGIQVSFTTL